VGERGQARSGGGEGSHGINLEQLGGRQQESNLPGSG
jgi:hypothetical protein